MGVYRNYVLPWLVDRTLRRPECARLRERVAAPLSGRVLEIGFGSGLNLPHYPADVQRVWAVDPAAFGRRLAAKRIAAFAAPVEFVETGGERVPLPDGAADAALSTWTLCSVPDPRSALAEIRRLLKPGGRFCFLEHGLAPEPRVARWQHRLNPVQRIVAGGCRLTLAVDALVRRAGFELEALETFYMPGPRLSSFMYLGSAIPRKEAEADGTAAGPARRGDVQGGGP